MSTVSEPAKTSRHTPGPWEVGHFVRADAHDYKPTDMGLYEVTEANGEVIALLRDGHAAEAEALADANRALIASAPAMAAEIAALRARVDALEEWAEWVVVDLDEGGAYSPLADPPNRGTRLLERAAALGIADADKRTPPRSEWGTEQEHIQMYIASEQRISTTAQELRARVAELEAALRCARLEHLRYEQDLNSLHLGRLRAVEAERDAALAAARKETP